MVAGERVEPPTPRLRFPWSDQAEALSLSFAVAAYSDPTIQGFDFARGNAIDPTLWSQANCPLDQRDNRIPGRLSD